MCLCHAVPRYALVRVEYEDSSRMTCGNKAQNKCYRKRSSDPEEVLLESSRENQLSFCRAMQMLCKCCANAVQMLCKCCANALQMLCKCSANAVQMLCKCCANAVQMLLDQEIRVDPNTFSQPMMSVPRPTTAAVSNSAISALLEPGPKTPQDSPKRPSDYHNCYIELPKNE